MDKKPIVFVSHAAADFEIANLFKADVEKSFLGLCELFVSSNLDSIQGGNEWMHEIKTHLKDAAVFIGLLSPLSLSRPWIYAEFGAGWIRGIPTISVCHSGLRKDQLPVPLSQFQALDLLDEMHLEHLYGQISTAIGCQKPDKDYSILTRKYELLTEVLRKERFLKQWHANILQWNPDFSKVFHNETIQLLIPAEAEQLFREFQNEMNLNRMLILEAKGMAMGTRVGAQASVWKVSQGDNFAEFDKLVNT
ncbi:MAG: hypothetical protein ACI9YH_004561 [Colwellia sp.]|jgi:hypothetical protein